MRVIIAEKMAPRILGAGTITAETLASKNFLAAIESGDSLFRIGQPLIGPVCVKSAGANVCSGDIIIEFREAEQRGKQGLHFALLEKLAELLKDAGSQETLEATLCLTSGSISAGDSETRERPNTKELGLWLRLDAKGDSPEQALLRWGLGLTHLQQALLFTSRHLRLSMKLPAN